MKFAIPILWCGMLVLAGAPALGAGDKPAASYADAEAARHAGEEAAVTGKVVSISKSAKGTIFLNFGDRFPKQTFSGVVFAKDAEAIGDLSAFEGKIVALTGRIELSPDGKPQIIIKSRDQVKLADEATPPPPSAAVPAPSPAPVPMPVPPAPPAVPPAPPPALPPGGIESRRIALGPNWNSAPPAGDITRKDLAALFGGQLASGEGVVAEESIVIYPGVPYLTPLAVARRSLHLENTNPTRRKVTTPGFPAGSLTANAFTGIFPGGYTTMTLLADTAEQVVSVHLGDENPRVRATDLTDTGGYQTVNFIAQRMKAAPQLVIKHEIIREGAPAGVVVVDSLLIDPSVPDPAAPRTSGRPSKTSSSHQPRSGKVLERSRWYVPRPLVSIILRSAGNR